MRATTRPFHGFSLIELSVVLTIVAVVLAAGIDIIAGGKVEKIESTKDRIEVIKGALTNYRNRNNNKMPCPAPIEAPVGDSRFGNALSELQCKLTAVGTGTFRDLTSGIRIGAVPVNTLGLANKYAFDSWGNRITYVVSEDAVDGTDTITGSIPITDQNDTVIASPIFLVMSHGADGLGAYNYNGVVANPCDNLAATRIDAANCAFASALDLDNVAPTFRAASFNDGDVEANRFDDLVEFSFSNSLVPECAADEKLAWDSVTSNWECTKILDGCSADQLIVFDGANWSCQNAQSTVLNALPACADGQGLTYDATLSTWVCGIVSDGSGGGASFADCPAAGLIHGQTSISDCPSVDPLSCTGNIFTTCTNGSTSTTDSCSCVGTVM